LKGPLVLRTVWRLGSRLNKVKAKLAATQPSAARYPVNLNGFRGQGSDVSGFEKNRGLQFGSQGQESWNI